MRTGAGRVRFAAALLAALWSWGGSAHADIIFSNFGSGDSYDPFDGWTVGQIPEANATQHVAVLFRVGSRPVLLDRVDVAIGVVFPPNVVDLEILPEVRGAPGTDSQALETFHVANRLPPFGGEGPPLMVNSTLRPLLDANTNYWLAAIASQPTSDMWNDNALPFAGQVAFRDNNGSWIAFGGDMTPVFRILATPVAEPATIALLGAGLLGLLGCWRKSSVR